MDERLEKAKEATKKAVLDRKSQEDEAEEDTVGDSEEEREKIPQPKAEPWSNERKELDKFEALELERIPLEENQLKGRRQGTDPLQDLREWSMSRQRDNATRSRGLVHMYS